VSILAKFNREQNTEIHGGRLAWPGDMSGYPMRLQDGQNAPLLKQHETEELDHAEDFKFRMFDLSKEEDRREYQFVMDRIVSGWFRCLKREHIYNKETEAMKVFVEWTQVYAVPPPTTP
jgi:hypothetical protein